MQHASVKGKASKGEARSPATVLAFLGGTFDPVHYGHLLAAREARQALDAADFKLLPAGQPPHRQTLASCSERVQMLRLALTEFPDLGLDTREVERPGPSWMVDTLAELRREHPERPLVLVLGQDAANGLDGWHEWRQLFSYAHLGVMNRPDEEPRYAPALAEEMRHRSTTDTARLGRELAGCVLPIRVRSRKVSATDLRAALAVRAPVQGWLPAAVADYIASHGLYRGVVHEAGPST